MIKKKPTAKHRGRKGESPFINLFGGHRKRNKCKPKTTIKRKSEDCNIGKTERGSRADVPKQAGNTIRRSARNRRNKRVVEWRFEEKVYRGVFFLGPRWGKNGVGSGAEIWRLR